VDSHIVVLSEKVIYEHKQYKNIHILPFPHVKNLEWFGKARRIARWLQHTIADLTQDRPFDAIYSHLDESNVVVDQLTTPSPCFYVVHISTLGELRAARERGWLKYWRLKQKKKALNDKHIVAVSNGVQQDLERIPWLTPKRITTIYNPINQQLIETLSQDEKDAQRIPAEPFLLHIGRFSKAKRHDVLLDAFQQAVTTNPTLKLVLLVKVTAKLKAEINARQLNNNVILPGFVENPFPWIKRAKLLLLSSSYEGFPNVLVESLVCETPFISTDCDHGPREIVRNYADNWLVPVGCATSLARKIEEFTAEPPTVNLQHWPLLQQIQPDYATQAYLSLDAS
jgi:glycosyltransferase involved in cell wall biosynthesis